MLKQITDGVLVHQSELLQNNTVVVQGDKGVLLVDAGITNAEMQCLASDLKNMGLPVVVGFATHPDWDHALWHPALGNAPRYGTAAAAAFLTDFLSKPDWKEQFVEGLPPEIATEVPAELFGLITALPEGATRLTWDGPEARVLEHKAHAQGHAGLFIEKHGVLAAGDMLSDVFVPMLALESADPIGDYLDALELFESVADKIDVVVPGHGSVARGDQVRARIDQDRAYVQALRDGKEVKDPRITSPPKGWEWVSSIHDWQAQQIAQKRSS